MNSLLNSTESKDDTAEGGYIEMSDDDDSDDDSSGSASSDSTSEEDIKPSEDVRNTVCMLQNNSKLFL